MYHLRTIARRSVLAFALMTAASAASAFPDKPVHLVVPYPAGGATDASARIVAEKLTALWGQTVIVDNRPGATGAIGTEYVAKSAADGYTLLLQVPIMLSTELIRPSVGYRTLRDFAPVTSVFSTPIVYLTSGSAPKGTLNDVLTAARAAPGTISYGHHGEGTTTHYMGKKLEKVSGAQMTAVPYNGDSPILLDLLGGHIQTGFLSGLNAKKAAETGKARMLAVASSERSPLMPDTPTFLEAGVEGFDRESWGKVFAPKGTPQAVIDRIARDVTSIVGTEDVQTRFNAMGLVGTGGTAAETSADVQADYDNWVGLIKEFGLLAKP